MMYNCNNHKTIFSHNKGVPVANSIHHSNSIYNYFKSLKLGLFLSDVYLNHLMIIMVSVFLRGYRGKTIDFAEVSCMHRTTTAYFLNHGKWDDSALQDTKVIEAFEKENPDIVIKQNVVPDAQEVLMTRASSDSLPDMMNHWPTDAQFVQFEDEGLLLDLSEKDYMKNIDSKYLDAVKAKDGKNYIAPYNVNFMGVYYNKDKFEEAGYTMPTKWDELIALAEEIKAKGETPFILPNKDSWTVSNLWSNIEARDLGSHEDEFEKMKAGEESFETIPEYKSGVEKMIQLLDYANEDSLALGYDQAINDFANGEGWMFLQGSWTLPSFLSANPDFNVEFTILPNDNGKPIATQAVDTGFCVNAKVADEPEKMEAIDKFLSFALSAEGAQIYTDNDKSPSCVTGVKAEVPQFQPFFDYVEANGFEADGAYPPTGFEDTKRGKIQNVLLDKDVDAFLKEMTNDWNQAVEDSK